jgi:tetratricopeptide (TPR) repeat protein
VREPEPAAPPPAGRRRSPVPAVLGAALAAVAVVALVVALTSGGDPQGSAGRRQAQSTQPPKERARTATTAAGEQQQPAKATAPPVPPPPPPPPPASTPAATGAAQLNDRGFALSNQGRYAEAVTPLRQSVDAYQAAGQSGLPYAYALFNLARALNRSGHPDEAIPLLQQRLRYADQPEVVKAELRDAQARLAGSGAGTTKPDKAKAKKNPR